jgi:hypothetical protein
MSEGGLSEYRLIVYASQSVPPAVFFSLNIFSVFCSEFPVVTRVYGCSIVIVYQSVQFRCRSREEGSGPLKFVEYQNEQRDDFGVYNMEEVRDV